MTVIALGSINMDLVIKAPRLPGPGETLMGHEFFSAFGGKGANQAVAVAKLGHPVSFVGQVGGDDFGQTLLLALQAAGVRTDGVSVNPEVNSGVASIVISETGENTIACAAGANGEVGQRELDALAAKLPSANLLLLELGVSLNVVEAAARMAQEQGVTTLLDPAPVPPEFPPALYNFVDIITPNEIEASQLVRFEVCDRTSARQAAKVLQNRGVETVIITLGEKGVLCLTPQEEYFLDAHPVEVVDTVAAGDAFNGALATALSLGKSLSEALQWANKAGSLAVTKMGAQSSLPNREQLIIG